MPVFELLDELCMINGISGDEKDVREYIISKIKDKCEYRTDALGNLIAYKKGNTTPDKKVMISAHMDEVGMIVNYINSDGTLCVLPVGGINAGVVIGRRVTVGKNKIPGVVGSKPIHNLTAEEKKTPADFKKFYVDIGADSREEAEKLVELGECVYFDSEYKNFGDGYIKCKAIDDRLGCAIMIDMINSELMYDCYFTFVVQEEVGLRGSKVAAYSVEPDFAIVLESTTAADIPASDGANKCCELGKGAVVSYMDRATIYDKELYELSYKTAKENSIGWQTKTMVAGGNDSGAIHQSGGGVRVIAISAPCRYLHSPICVIKKSDAEDCRKLAFAMLDAICKL